MWWRLRPFQYSSTYLTHSSGFTFFVSIFVVVVVVFKYWLPDLAVILLKSTEAWWQHLLLAFWSPDSVQIEAYELSLSFLGGQHLCCCCWNSGKRRIRGTVLANLAACFFSPLGCAQYSVWVWEDLSAFFLCTEAMRNEATDLSYTTAWKNRPWPNK